MLFNILNSHQASFSRLCLVFTLRLTHSTKTAMHIDARGRDSHNSGKEFSLEKQK